MRRRIHIETPDSDGQAVETPAAPLPEQAEETMVSPEETAQAVESARQEAEVDALHAQIASLEQQVEQERNQYLRTLADFQNYRRRQDEERSQSRQYANQEIMLGLLPILDNFERALAAAEKSQSYEALMGGVALTMRQLQDLLRKHGVEPINAVGQEFDPHHHEAVMRVEDSDHPENMVVEELQKGYRMHGRVLRPSMVKVAKSE